jgi:hypothetical protein
MIRMAAAIQQDLEYDRRLQDVPRLLPSSLALPALSAAEFCVNYVSQLRTVLAQAPPNQPTENAIDMLVAVAQLQRCGDGHAHMGWPFVRRRLPVAGCRRHLFLAHAVQKHLLLPPLLLLVLLLPLHSVCRKAKLAQGTV